MAQSKYGFLPLSVLALTSVSTLAVAEAQEGMEEVKQLSTPSSSLSVGAAYSTDDQTLLGRYNGRSDSGTYLSLDFDINQRDDKTGTWTQVSGRNVGLSNRNLRYERNKQGDWNYFIEYDQLDSVNPYQYQTDLTGIGSSSQATGGATIKPQFSQERKNVKIGMGKHLTKDLNFAISYRQEKKEGDKAWGANPGYAAGFIVEPIDYRTQEVEAKLDYSNDGLQLRAGYLLSLFDSSTESVELDNDGNATVDSTIATPPDNQAHNLYLSGGYKLSETTRATFKVAKLLERQDEAFFMANVASPTRTSLDAKVDTTRVNLGIVSRVMPQLTLKAKLRYDDRDDKTPQSVFIAPDRLNQQTSRTTTNGTLDATYRVKPGMALTAGVDHEKWKRNVTDEPNMAKREKTDETTFRLGARKNLSDTLNASVRLSHGDRDGSDWIPGAADPILVNPIQWSDRKRDKLRLALDWYATEQLSLQLVTEGSKDRYSGAGSMGPSDGKSALVSLDAGYQLNDEWSLTAWVSANETSMQSSTHTYSFSNKAGSEQTWAGDAEDSGVAYGLGVKGEPSELLKVGGQLQFSEDDSTFNMTSIVAPVDSAFAPASALPTITYKQVSLKLFGEYAMDEQRGVRLDYHYEKLKNDDWTWNNFNGYASTTVTQADEDSNSFIGLSYYYRGW